MTDKREELIDVLVERPQHKISGNSQGGCDCRCGARWDWQKSEKEAAERHAAGYLADRLLAVFEQAHTPTEHPAHSGHEYGGGYARAAALAAGDPDWMNATGGTPTDDELEAAAERYRQDTGWTMAEGHAVVEAFLAGAAAGFRRTVQGEPTDAQVLAALNAHYRVRLAQSEPMPGDPEVEGDAHSLEEYSSKSIDRMRAALRAATQEGEER